MDDRDSQLARRAMAGDGAAFDGLHLAHAGRVTVYFVRSGFAPADAEDLTQETFTRAFRSLKTFDGRRGAFAAWLAAIARNVARKRWRKRIETSFDPELAEEVLCGTGDRGGPPDEAGAREEIQAVRECVASLPAELGRIVRMRYVDGRTTRGIADAIAMPESTVRMRLGEAKSLLEKCLRAKGILE